MSNITAKSVVTLVKQSASQFMHNNSFRLAAALAYNTIFSLPPLLVIILVSAGAIFGQEALNGEIYEQSRAALGDEAAKEVQTMIASTSQLKKTGVAAAIGVGMIIFAATTFFITLQDSLNHIWNIKVRPDAGIMQTIKARVLSLGVITLLFTLIYKFLPDALIRWKDTLAGAFITALLFVVGKILIGVYLGYSDVGSAYGAAGSVIIILVWIYYSGLIIFFGAEFTQQYTDRFGAKVRPKSYAMKYDIIEAPYHDPDDEKAGRPQAEGRFRK